MSKPKGFKVFDHLMRKLVKVKPSDLSPAKRPARKRKKPK